MKPQPVTSALLLLDLDQAEALPWTEPADEAVSWTAVPQEDTAARLAPLFPQRAPRVPTPDPLPALLEAARQEGFREGEQAGRLAAEAAREASVAATVAAIAAALEDSAASAAAVMEGAADALAQAILTALTTALPSLAGRFGAAEAVQFAEAILPGVAEDLRLDIVVAPDIVELVAARFAGETRVAVAADASLAPGDVRLRWRDGLAERRAAGAVKAVLRTLEAIFPFAPKSGAPFAGVQA